MIKQKILKTIAIISCFGIIALIILDFYGGIVIYILSYFILILPVFILYLISFIDTLLEQIRRGFNIKSIKLISHLIVLFSFFVAYVYQSDLLKSKVIMSATLQDDIYNYKLTMRENGKCEIKVQGFMGFEETFYGKYVLKKDTIIFLEKPYENDFIPDTLLIDRKQNAIFVAKDSSNKFDTIKTFLNHFEINKNK